MSNVLLIGPTAFFIGLILLGLAAVRGHILPRWSGFLLAIGTFIWFIAYVLSVVPSLLTAVSLITGAGLAWSCWAIWSGRVARGPFLYLLSVDRYSTLSMPPG